MKKKLNITILSGAGISAESGISTFRDAGGLWEGHDVMEVASPKGWLDNRALVIDFYNQRRRQLQNVQPNKAHIELAELANSHHVSIVTQNVDDLHERAGSDFVIHLHGQLLKVRSTLYPHLVYDWVADMSIDDICENGAPLRPDIVWFGEAVPLMEKAVKIVRKADVLIVVGTSLQVYPAAGLMYEASPDCKIFYVDPMADEMKEQLNNYYVQCIPRKATEGIEEVINIINTY